MTHDCSDELKQASLRVTPARIAALRHIESHEAPVDAQDLISFLQRTMNVDRVTVFRILNTFTEKKLLRKVEFGEGKARYERAREEHHHLICSSCGKIDDIAECSLSALTKKIAKEKGFAVTGHNLEFFGLCRTCQRKGKN